MSKSLASISRTAGAASCPRRRPLRLHINDWINAQAANPRGVFAWLLAAIWRRDHAALNAATIELLGLAPDMTVVDIGCGPGAALAEIAKRRCLALGLDVSTNMVGIARRSNAKAVAAGRVAVRHISDGELGLEARSVDHAMSVHSIYFWSSPDEVVVQLAAALKGGGRLVLAFTPESPSVSPRLRGPSYRFYRIGDVERYFAAAGLTNVRRVEDPEVSQTVVWVVGEKA